MKVATWLLTVCLAGSVHAQCEQQWSIVAPVAGANPPAAPAVFAIAEFNGEIVVGGMFTTIGGQSIWSLAASGDGGATWHSLGGDVINWAVPPPHGPGTVNALLVRPEGLYVGGLFEEIGGVPLAGIARWDGTTWHALDEGLANGEYAGEATALLDMNDHMVVVGGFPQINPTTVDHATRWTGAAWNHFNPIAPHTHGIKTAAPWGNGFVATAGFESTVFGWDGTQWFDLPYANGTANAFIGYHGELYSCMGRTGGVRVVQRLKGSTWVETAPLPTYPISGCTVYDLHIHNDQLLAGGTFRTNPAASGPNRVARWDGAVWQAVGIGPSATVRHLASIRNELWAGCSGTVEKFACACYANCDQSSGSPLLTANDFVCFVNAFSAGQPYANCDGSNGNPLLSGNDFVCFMNRYAAGCP